MPALIDLHLIIMLIYLDYLNKILLRVTDAKIQKHTTGGIPRWSPTLVLVARFSAYVWQSGRDAQFSLTYGRMCSEKCCCAI